MPAFNKITTPSQLADFIAEDCPHFFDKSTMRFFGDTMRNYGIRHHDCPEHGPVVELYRRRPVKHGLSKSAFFCLVEGCTDKAERLHSFDA